MVLNRGGRNDMTGASYNSGHNDKRYEQDRHRECGDEQRHLIRDNLGARIAGVFWTGQYTTYKASGVVVVVVAISDYDDDDGNHI